MLHKGRCLMARNAPFSDGEDPKVERPRRYKACYCGGHSMHDKTKNKHHHGTLMKLSYRMLRKAKHTTI
jgi:hypothetical protein